MIKSKKIQQRIQDRVYNNDKQKQGGVFNFFYCSMMFALLLGIGLLSNSIYQINGFQPLINSASKIIDMTHLTDLKQWLFLENWLDDNSTTVFNAQNYTYIADNYYAAMDSEVVSIADGIVIYCEKQDSGYVVMVKNDNSTIATYGALNEVNCAIDDRILQDSVIGKVIDNVYMEFSYNGKSVGLEEVNEINN